MDLAMNQQTEAYGSTGVFSHGLNPTENIWMPPGVGGLKQVFYLHQGSGGMVACLFSISPSGAKIQVHTEPRNKLANTISEICEAFYLTKEELAQACNIQSRKTLYNWINGDAKPRKSAMARVFDLLIAARAWQDSGFTTNRDQLHVPVLGGKSVFDLLNQPEIDKERILFAGSRLTMLAPAKDALIDPFA